jgi:hypothetical protein
MVEALAEGVKAARSRHASGPMMILDSIADEAPAATYGRVDDRGCEGGDGVPL